MAEQFPIVPPAGTASWPLVVGAVIMLLAAGFFVFLSYSVGRETFLITSAGLTISGNLYGRTIPSRSLLPENARALDITANEAYRLKSRTNGTGLPGYKAGWFRCDNGKVLVFLTDQRHVAAIPTSEGYTLLLSVADPAAFIQSLKTTLRR